MKPKTKREKKNAAAQVDALGHEFEKGQNLADEGNALMRLAKEKAQSLAASAPDEECSLTAKGRCVVGQEFLGGFYDRDGSRKFDEAQFSKDHPSLYNKCTVLRRVFDEDLFMRLVNEKKITKEMVKKYTQVGPSIRVAYIKRRDAKA